MEKLPPIPSPPGTAFREFRVKVVPALAFVVVLGFTVWMWRHQAGPTNLVGEVEMRRAVLTSVQPGRVARLLVEPLQAVTNNQPVVELVPADLSPVEAEASPGQARPEPIRHQLHPVILTSPIDGFVSVIHRQPGENTVAGEPLVTISASRGQHIVAFIRQPVEQIPATNQVVEVRSRAVGRDAGIARVLRVGRQMELILPELLPVKPAGNQTPEYGLPLLVSLPEGFAAVPGEILDLRLVSP